MRTLTYKFKLPFLGITDKDFDGMSFGRRLEYQRKIEEWKKTAKKDWISQKRKSASVGIKEFVSLNKPSAYYVAYLDKKKNPNYWDDSFEIWYVSDTNNESKESNDE